MNDFFPVSKTQTAPQMVLLVAGLLCAWEGYAQDYTYDALNRLTTVTTPDGQTLSYHYDAAGNLQSVTTTRSPPTTPCLLYGVFDVNRSDSQFVTVNPYQAFEVNPLGGLHRYEDIEALDIHPTTHQLYAAAGADGVFPGAVYTVDSNTGELTLVGPSGFGELNGISFRADGSLWGWATGAGVVQLDTQTGQGTLVIPAPGTVEDLSWENEGMVLYAVARHQFWAYNTQTASLTELHCALPEGKIEALEMLPDGRLLFAVHHDQKLQIHALDWNSCTTVNIDLLLTLSNLQPNDIEGLAWPQGACLFPSLQQ